MTCPRTISSNTYRQFSDKEKHKESASTLPECQKHSTFYHTSTLPHPQNLDNDQCPEGFNSLKIKIGSPSVLQFDPIVTTQFCFAEHRALYVQELGGIDINNLESFLNLYLKAIIIVVDTIVSNDFQEITMVFNRRLVSFDWAMKRLLRSKANFDILEGFLSELLHQDIKIVEILESETNKELKQDKYSKMDLKVKNSDGEIILIEVQYESEIDFLQRLLYGISRTITDHLHQGDSYSKIVKVISIAIVYFDLGKGSDYIYRGTTSFVGIHNQEPLALSSLQKKVYQKDFPGELYPEMYIIKVKNFDDFAKNTLDEWIYFLKNEEIKDSFKARGLLKAKKELDIMKMTDEQRKQYRAYLDDLSYQASMVESTYGVGKIEGEQIGIKKGKAFSIIELLQEGDISFKKAQQKIDKLKLQAPNADFWPEIFEALNKYKP